MIGFFCAFSGIAGRRGGHRRQEEEEKKKIWSFPLVTVHRRRRVGPRAASGGGAWADAPPASPALLPFPVLFQNFVWYFSLCLCILFELVLYFFNCILKNVIKMKKNVCELYFISKM